MYMCVYTIYMHTIYAKEFELYCIEKIEIKVLHQKVV